MTDMVDMKNPSRSRPLVVFAQAPPPEHGQNRMVKRMLDILAHEDGFEVVHINTSYSDTLDEVGRGSFTKLFRGLGYMTRAVIKRLRLRDPVLYYIPGPLKWSALTRDWMVLGVLRLFYRRVVFHWHAIGQGEWAHGSNRLQINAPLWLIPATRWLSRMVLRRPDLSIVVSDNSARDANAIGSREIRVVANGCDPPPESLLESSLERRGHRDQNRHQHWLFLSRGTEEKGLTDLMEAMASMNPDSSGPSIQLTIAGGITKETRPIYEQLAKKALHLWGDRLSLIESGFVSGGAKWAAYADADLFIAPSRWESFGLVATEAMAMKLPIVACDCDGLKGVLAEDYPLMANTRDPSSLATVLDIARQMLTTPEAETIREALHRRYLNQFRIDCFGRDLLVALRSQTHPDEHGSCPGKLRIATYLADQNPKLGRSLGISRMTEVVLETLSSNEEVQIHPLVSTSSIQGPARSSSRIRIPWPTKSNLVRMMTDNLHPLLRPRSGHADVWFFPKGFMPRLHGLCQPSVAMIHDTIIQFYQDKYPQWRTATEYSYWASMLRQTLVHATEVMTVSRNSRRQIEEFIERHHLPERRIHVTYEPCSYESVPQPEQVAKSDYVLHLASREPHKRTDWLVRLWVEEYSRGRQLPKLHIVGTLPGEAARLAEECASVVHFPFLEDPALVSQFMSARALIFPSEIEGFGLPAIEAYYLGTPVCYTAGTSMEEILAPVTPKGGFNLEDNVSFWQAYDTVLEMNAEEVRSIGLQLRETFDSSRVTERMMGVFRTAADSPRGAHREAS